MLKLYRNPISTTDTENAQIVFHDYRANKTFSVTLEKIEGRKAYWINDTTGTTFPVQRGNEFYPNNIRMVQGYVDKDKVTIYIDAPDYVNIRRADVPPDPVKAKRTVKFTLGDRIRMAVGAV